MKQWHDELGVFDLETTGVDVATSRIVSAHVGVLDSTGAIVERLDWLVDPGVPIPPGASAVHGITTERARAEGRPAADAVVEIVAALRGLLLRGIPVVAYNAPYDLSLLHHEALRHGVEPLSDPTPVIDPLVIDKAVDKYRRGKRTLTVTAEHYGVDLIGAHDAAADAIAAGRVAQAIARAFPLELAVAADELHSLQVRWSNEQALDFQDYMRRVKDPTFTARGEWPIR
ncbi:3'-5' exonuclease [Planctomonas sp. JC2975]|uniref:exonuclease domain-containing protein n=1 Tax=Planctomonas sp. JC2975 TaxID=2729626 RepID=UPI001474E5C0|nr:exonuclease domain-containing protein [Planctomonas sp. JC2975]NNC10483.1 3'-5' exonuclease [Planctomonas sp. JC2975]